MAASDADNALMLATIDVNLTRLEKSLAKANALVTGNTKNMGRSLGTANKRLQADLDKTSTIYSRATKRIKAEASSFNATLVGAFAGGFAGGAIATALANLPQMVGAITSSLADLRAEAEKSGLGLKQFQELKYAAELTRIPVDALTDGMKELQLRADEYIIGGKGSAADAFARLGLSIDDVKTRLADPVALLDEIIRRTKDLDKAAQIRVFDEIFGGTGGERMVSLLSQSTKSLKDMRQEAHEVGAVLDDDVFEKAVEIDQAFTRITATIGTGLKGALVEVVDLARTFADLLQPLEKQSTATILKQIADNEATIAKARGWGANPAHYENENAKLRRELARRALLNPTDPTGSTDWLRAPATPGSATGGGSRVPVPGARPNGLEFDGWDRDNAAARERADAIRTVVTALDEELAALSRTAVENEALQRIREAGVAADSAEAQAIREKVAALHAERAAREAATDAAREAADAAERAAEEAQRSEQDVKRAFGEGLYDVFRGGIEGAEGFAAALQNVTDRLAEMILRATLLGDGPLASLFGLQGRDGGIGGLIGLALGNPTGAAPVAPSASPAGAAPVTSVPLPAVTQAVQTATTSAMDVAKGWLGTTETGSPAALSKFFQTAGFSLDPRETAWCAAFANAALAQQGIQGTGSLAARSFETWGEGVDPSQAMPGDVAVFSRPEGGPGAGHVGFFDGYNADGSIRVLGGNQSNSVSYTDMPASQLLGFRRAPQALAASADTLATTATTFTGDMTGSLGEIAAGTANAGGGFLGAFGGALQSIVGGLGGDAGGGLGIFGAIFSGLGSLIGFADGGFTGPGRKHEPAGLVHRGEVVWSQRDVARAGGVGVVEAMRLGRLPGFAEGGLADPRRARLPSLGAGRAGAQSVTIAPRIDIRVEGGSRGEAADTELAKRIGKDVEGSVRGLVAKELLQQRRPGGLLAVKR